MLASIQAAESVLSMQKFVTRRFLKELTRFQIVVAEELKYLPDTVSAILGTAQKGILRALAQFPSTKEDRSVYYHILKFCDETNEVSIHLEFCSTTEGNDKKRKCHERGLLDDG